MPRRCNADVACVTLARAYKTRGIVLRARNLGEADKIFTLFTRDARQGSTPSPRACGRAKSRLAGRLEFAGEVALGMHRGRDLDVITSADLVAPSWAHVVAPGAFATAHIVAELVDAFCEPDLAAARRLRAVARRAARARQRRTIRRSSCRASSCGYSKRSASGRNRMRACAAARPFGQAPAGPTSRPEASLCEHCRPHACRTRLP